MSRIITERGRDVTKNQIREFDPDYTVTPGEILGELLLERDITQNNFASRIQMSPKTLNQIIKGKAPITPETALKFETATGMSATTWGNLESLYRTSLAKAQQEVQLEKNVSWLDGFPISDLRKLNYLVSSADDKVGQVAELLRFFEVVSPQAWEEVWLQPQAAFRTSRTYTRSIKALSVWLRLGDIQVRSVETKGFSKDRISQDLSSFRALMRVNGNDFAPKLKSLCQEHGIALVFVPELSGTRCSGAARWLAPDRAMIQMSLRHKTDDHFWFTFFHELGHLLKHSKKTVFVDVEDGSIPKDQEEEADRFAEICLIPSQYEAELQNLQDHGSVQAFAKKIGASEGAVVGRLQYLKIWPFTKGNELKIKIDFGRN